VRRGMVLRRLIFALLPALALCSCSPATQTGVETQVTALIGGTVLDLDNWGTSEDDIEDSVVLLEGDRITAVGPRGEIAIPAGATRIDVSGKFILPGLIDAFAALNNQTYADAYLYMGVTSIIAVDDERRGAFFGGANPGPAVYRLEGVGEESLSTGELLEQINRLHEEGYRVVLLMYKLTPDQLQAAVEHAHKLGMGTIGELGLTGYGEALATNIDAFVHTTRYSLDIAPPEMAAAVAAEPFSDDLESPKWRYYKYLTGLDPQDERLAKHAAALGRGGATLMPTFSLLYLDLPDSANLWHEPVAAILDPADINNPADRETGRHGYDPEHTKAYADLALQEFMLERTYRAAGARYLAGSGTDVWGTMPGISMHTEMMLLTRIGLSPREAIAAATWNVAETFRWHEIGAVEAGRRADLIVVGADPLSDLQNLKQIDVLIRNGEIIDRGSLLEKHHRQ
jgi:hypothetical protein